MRDDTIFRIYSMSKPITSIALMMLFEEGRFQLTDPVHKFIPSWRKHRVWVEGEGDAMKTRRPESPMTIQHLLCHTPASPMAVFYRDLNCRSILLIQQPGISRAGTDTLEQFVTKLAGSTAPI